MVVRGKRVETPGLSTESSNDSFRILPDVNRPLSSRAASAVAAGEFCKALKINGLGDISQWLLR